MEQPDFKLILSDSSRSLADYTASVVGSDPLLFAAVMDIAWQQRPQLGMRAARVADLACELNPDLVRPHLLRLVREVPELRDMGVKRVFMHILTRHSWVDDEDAMGGLVDALIRWLSDEAQSIAVKYYAMMILSNITNVLPELRIEISAVLEEVIPHWESAALQRAGRRTMAHFRKSRRVYE
jgi:hypothetical protein